MSNANTVKQLKAKLEKSRKAAEAKIARDAEIANLEAAISVESSESFIKAKANLARLAIITDAIQGAINQCKFIVSSNPVANKATRSDRVWSGSAKYGYGSHVGLLYTLATGITYSCNEHKELMLANTNLDMHTLEAVISSFGNSTYFSAKTNTIVDATPYDVQGAIDSISIMASILGVVVDTSLLTENTFAKDFARGEIAAYKAEKEHQEALRLIDALEGSI